MGELKVGDKVKMSAYVVEILCITELEAYYRYLNHPDISSDHEFHTNKVFFNYRRIPSELELALI